MKILFTVTAIFLFIVNNAKADAYVPVVPADIIGSDGRITTGDLQLSCSSLLSKFGIPTISPSNFVDEENLLPTTNMTCAQFAALLTPTGSLRHGVITGSIKITSACTFSRTSLEIAASNVSLDCGGSTFTGGDPSDRDISIGLRLAISPQGSTVPAANTAPLSNIRVSNCNFENYRDTGVQLASYFNRRNPVDQNYFMNVLKPMFDNRRWDTSCPKLSDGTPKPGTYCQDSPAEILRAKSPSKISLNNIYVRNTSNAGIYVQNSLTQIDISRVKTLYTRLGVYMDFGTRKVQVRNSCFMLAGEKDPTRTPADIAADDNGPREAIAVDASSDNTVTNNLMYLSPRGGVWAYKNCWERYNDWESNPGSMAQYPRRQPSDNNTIKNNVIVGGEAGVWLGSRQWKDWMFSSSNPDHDPAHCGDRRLLPTGATGAEDPLYYVYPDFARNNTVKDNTFFTSSVSASHPAIRSYDDGNIFTGNRFYGPRVTYLAIIGQGDDLVYRKRPILNNQFNNNKSYISGVPIGDENLLVSFRGDARAHSRASGNTHNDGAMPVNNVATTAFCSLPISVIASNDPTKNCRFGDTLNKVQPQGTAITLTDGGTIHGQLNLTCESNGLWKANSGYCCTGTGCNTAPNVSPNITGTLEQMIEHSLE